MQPLPQINNFKDISNLLETAKEMEWLLQEKQKNKFFHDINIIATAAFQQGNYKRVARFRKMELTNRLADMEAVNQ